MLESHLVGCVVKMSGDELTKALEKFDERTKQRLAKRIMTIADEEVLPESQRNTIRMLKVICPIGLILTGPIVAYVYSKVELGILFWLSLFPLAFLALISTIVNVLLKTPE